MDQIKLRESFIAFVTTKGYNKEDFTHISLGISSSERLQLVALNSPIEGKFLAFFDFLDQPIDSIDIEKYRIIIKYYGQPTPVYLIVPTPDKSDFNIYLFTLNAVKESFNSIPKETFPDYHTLLYKFLVLANMYETREINEAHNEAKKQGLAKYIAPEVALIIGIITFIITLALMFPEVRKPRRELERESAINIENLQRKYQRLELENRDLSSQLREVLTTIKRDSASSDKLPLEFTKLENRISEIALKTNELELSINDNPSRAITLAKMDNKINLIEKDLSNVAVLQENNLRNLESLLITEIGFIKAIVYTVILTIIITLIASIISNRINSSYGNSKIENKKPKLVETLDEGI